MLLIHLFYSLWSEGVTAPRYRLASYLASGISAANGLPDFNTP
ncbi:hypothetical protein ACX1GR_13510 [Yersinia enterocolitica]